MTTYAGSVGWRRLREFAGVEISRSFVLSWKLERNTLEIDADVQLLPEHPFYERPRPRQKACIRPATIEFPHCVSIRASGQDVATELQTAVDGLGSGAISDLERLDEGPYVLSGEFGRVEIDAERPILRLHGP
jgi:hypothetical protein